MVLSIFDTTEHDVLTLDASGNVTVGATLSAPGIATDSITNRNINGPILYPETGDFLLATNGAAKKGLIIQGAGSQSANLQEWQTSVAAIVASMSPTGVLNLAATTPTTNAGDIYNDTNQKKHGAYTNGIAGWFEKCIFSAYAPRTQAGIVTAQSIIPTTYIGTLTLPANFWKLGKAIRVRLQGYYSTDAGPGNATITIKLGSTTYRTTGSFALDNSVTNGWWAMDFAIVCESTGVTGSVDGMTGWQHVEATSGNFIVHNQANNTVGPVTIDTTQSMTFDVLWTADDAGTSITTATARIWEVA
jgi:hypothetical protein